MSDNETSAPAPPPAEPKSQFTAKEEAVLKVAWLCLKTGAPEIDMEKLKELGGFNTVKTASNTWGVIKKKLNVNANVNVNGEATASPKAGATNGDPTTLKSTKKGTPSIGRKRGRKNVPKDDNEEEDIDQVRTLSGNKKPRKSPVDKAVKSEPV